MIIASDEELNIENTVEINTENGIILTDNYCPVDSIIPDVDR